MYDEDFTTCDTCHHLFTTRFKGQTTCYNCWKDTPAGREWCARKKRERERRSSYYDSGGGFYRDQAKYSFEQGQEGARSSQEQRSGPEVRVEYRDLPGFDLAMCRLLLQLSHPDKHQGSDASVKAAQWLNARLKELKGGK